METMQQVVLTFLQVSFSSSHTTRTLMQRNLKLTCELIHVGHQTGQYYRHEGQGHYEPRYEEGHGNYSPPVFN